MFVTDSPLQGWLPPQPGGMGHTLTNQDARVGGVAGAGKRGPMTTSELARAVALMRAPSARTHRHMRWRVRERGWQGASARPSPPSWAGRVERSPADSARGTTSHPSKTSTQRQSATHSHRHATSRWPHPPGRKLTSSPSKAARSWWRSSLRENLARIDILAR